MKTLILTTALALIGTAALADAPAFPGADATPCDASQFTPIYGEDGTTVLYWNNPTCAAVGSGTSIFQVPEDEPVEG